jgi:hypothetical protein
MKRKMDKKEEDIGKKDILVINPKIKNIEAI